jgi:hypothetical protein
MIQAYVKTVALILVAATAATLPTLASPIPSLAPLSLQLQSASVSKKPMNPQMLFVHTSLGNMSNLSRTSNAKKVGTHAIQSTTGFTKPAARKIATRQAFKRLANRLSQEQGGSKKLAKSDFVTASSPLSLLQSRLTAAPQGPNKTQPKL